MSSAARAMSSVPARMSEGPARHRAHGLVQRRGGVVEVGLQALELGRQRALDARRQVAGRQPRQAHAQGRHGGGLLLLGRLRSASRRSRSSSKTVK
jgi:hypothetical protein